MEWLSSLFSAEGYEKGVALVAATLSVLGCLMTLARYFVARLFKIKKAKNPNAPAPASYIPTPGMTTWETWDKTGLWPLDAASRSIPLVGCKMELDILEEFLEGAESISLIVISGSGGRGKTRLALDFCDQLRQKKVKKGEEWHITFSPNETILKDWRNVKNTLIVIDNAASFTSQLKNWIQILHKQKSQILHEQKSHGSEKLRLILIERRADFESGWLKEICGDDPLQVDILSRELFTLPLKMGFTLLERCEIFTSLLEKLIEKPISAEEKKEFADKLAFKEWASEPLYLMMAALCCFKQAYRNNGEGSKFFGNVLDWGRSELVFKMVQIEESRFKKIADERSLDESLFKHLAACITLMGGLDNENLEFLAHEPQNIGYTKDSWWETEKKQWLEGLKLVLPPSSRVHGDGLKVLLPILPDIVGEAFVMCQLVKPVPAALRCYKNSPRDTLNTLGRAELDFLDFDFSELKESNYKILNIKETREAILKEAGNDLEALKKLAESLPEHSVMLRAFAVEVYEKLLEQQRANSENNENDEAALALTLNSLGNRYSALGQREEAIEVAREAVEIYQKLCESNRVVFLPDLAMSLTNLGNHYGELGQREDDLKVTQEAAEIYRELCASNPASFLPGLAGNLNNLGNCYSNLGQREEALKAAQEAAEIYRKLCESNPAAFLPNLAGGLNNLAICYSEWGEREEALKVAREVAKMYRELCESNPAAFLPDLASALNNLGSYYSELGEREDALKVTREAVEIRRELCESNSAAFLPDLAQSLNNLAIRYNEYGEREEALKVAREVAEMYQELCESNPAAFLPDLASSLNNLGVHYGELGQREEALKAAQEAVEIRRKLCASNPAAFLPDLAGSLNNLGNRYSDIGQREEALQAGREAVEIFRMLYKATPAAFSHGLTTSLNNLAKRYSESGREEEARECLREVQEMAGE